MFHRHPSLYNPGHPAPPSSSPEYDHGDQCECLVLAAVVGAGREAIGCAYCRNVLQKHWRIRCNHGEHGHGPPSRPASERWRDTGRIDGIKAILIREGIISFSDGEYDYNMRAEKCH